VASARYDQTKIDALSKEQIVVLERAVETIKKKRRLTDGVIGGKKGLPGNLIDLLNIKSPSLRPLILPHRT